MAFGGTVKLTGESEYKKALADITSNLKVLNSEMKVATSQYDSNDKSAENLTQQNDVLNKKIAEQKQKVDILSKALAEAEQETGENSETSKKWQIELNNAQAELNKLVKEVEKNEKAMKESADATDENADSLDKFGKEAEDSEKSALKLGDIIKANLISEGIMAGIKGLANAIKSVGSAFIDVGKQAIESYADYEQFVGGVETLFGDSADVVKGYANDAFKTAGMSANEYMEVVTGFSASLISSLDGDTKKASELSNMAIIDMSDNANKMGSDLESLKNAYSGFAKGQYNMLDNLKLGYGGTKTEMERLLADAEKLPSAMGRKFDISNYGDVVEAIHLVQEEMGIAGTTSKEASTTIAGSVSSMKSAWQNMLTGIADENANFEQLVGNLIESIVGKDGEGGVINNILPRIETALNGITKLVVGLVDTLLPQIIEMTTELIGSLLDSINTNIGVIISAGERMFQSLLNGIMAHSGDLVAIVVKLVNWLAQTVLDNLPMVLQAGIDILLALIQGITEVSYELIPCIINCVVSLVDTVLDNIDLIIDAGIELIMALADGLLEALPDLIDKIPVIIDRLIVAITDNLPKIIEMGIELTLKLAVGIIKAIPQLVSKIPQIITSLVNGLKSGLGKLADVGKNLVEGLWNGIKDATSWVLDKIKGFGKSVLNGIKGIFGIHSPSTVFRDEVGKNLALGLGEGFGDTMADVSADMQSAIPTEFDADINANYNTGAGYSSAPNYNMMVSAFKQALTEVKVVMNNREMGAFVTDTIERVVYA